MNINLENYEIWFLDYTEGNLDENQVADLFSFLEDHPDLKAELEEFEIINLNESKEAFLDKNILKKNVAFSSDDFIAYHEGDLSNEQMAAIDEFVAIDIDSKKEFDQLSKMYLTPYNDQVFLQKSVLKKGKKVFSTDDFIAYHEGDLSSIEMISIDEFIAKDNEAKKEFDQLGKIYLVPNDDKVFFNKSMLHQGGFLYTTDDYIAYHEGDMNEVEQKKLLNFLDDNPTDKNEFERFGSVYLVADGDLVYPRKGSLKKTEGKIIVMNWRFIAAAASILLVMALFFFQDEQDFDPEKNIVENTNSEDQQNDGQDSTFNKKNNSIVDPTNIEDYKLANENLNESEEKFKDEHNNQVAEEFPSNVNSKNKNGRNTDISNSSDNHKDKNNVAQQLITPKNKENNIKKNNDKIKDLESLKLIEYKTIAVEGNHPNKLRNTAKVPELIIVNDVDLAETKPKENNTESTTLLAFAEKKAAQVITDNKSKKLSLFDVIKKVGEKSRLYELQEVGDQNYNFKVANIEVDGKRKSISL